MNKKLKDFYFEHKNTFKFWIGKDKQLYDYLFQKSYPIDFTHLNLETRVAFVLNKMQRIPNCPTCNRQLDFENVGYSKGWRKFCCVRCADLQDTIDKPVHTLNSQKKWDKYVVNSALVQPLFTFEEFNLCYRDSSHIFKCKCKKCGDEFEAKYDENFFARDANKQSFFRCKKCFPLLNSHKSKAEKELFEFIKGLVGTNHAVKNGDRRAIHPHELDVFIPDLNIAFEFNGVFWHSTIHDGCEESQTLKMAKAEEAGIKLMVIWEDDWKFKNNEVKDKVKKFIEDGYQLLYESYDMNSDIIEIDRSIFNKCFSPEGFQLISEIPPQIVKRKHVNNECYYETPDYGKLVYKRCDQ